MNLEQAVDAFTAGFSIGKSFTHPYVCERFGRIWVMRDAPRIKGGFRLTELAIVGEGAADALEQIEEMNLGRYAVAVITTSEQARRRVKEDWKAHGFRLLGNEPLMTRQPTELTRPNTDVEIRRVRSQEDAERVGEAVGRRQILPEQLENGQIRLYAAWSGDAPVGWVRSTKATENGNWVSNLYVRSSHRGCGIGSALMILMLHDDFALGVKNSVLTASAAGAVVYTRLGYEQIGLLQLFMPKRG